MANPREAGALGKISAFALVVSALLVACSPAQVVPEAPAEVSVESQESPATPPPPAQPEECSEATVQELAAAITGQSKALTSGNFEEAYGFASPNFRAQVPLDVFQQIIAGQYAMLLSFEAASYGRCASAEDQRAVISIVVESQQFQPVTMIYQMVRVDGRWWVNGVDVPTSAVPNA